MTRMQRDARHARRPIADILRKSPWQGVDLGHIGGLVEFGGLKPKHIRDLDDFLTMREEIASRGGNNPDELRQTIVSFAEATGGVTKLANARKALLLIFDAEQLAGELAHAISSCARRAPPSRQTTPASSGRPLRHSIPESQLPQTWRTTLADMRDEFPGVDAPPPAPEITRGIARNLRQLAKTALDEDLPISLSREVAIAYEQSLARRDPALSPRTIQKYLSDIMTFAVYVGASPEFQKHMADRYRRSARRAGRASTLIDWKVAQIPDFRTIVDMAIDMLDKAKIATDLKSAHALRNRAAAISVVSALPLRVADLSLFFGTNITWTGENYHLFIPARSKPKEPYAATLNPVLGRFVDHLILRERPFSHLEDARDECMRHGRALFVNRWGEPVHRNYVSRCWWNVFGTGSHVARAKIHDEFARLGPRGVDLALASCGHRSDDSAEFYRSQAFDSFASAFVKDSLLADISEEEMREFL